ncbi:MAG: hypothetical protein A2941_00410 [Candidatus Yanofskybacteria bacterium RIFCSPLOWO2_01_FULL_49_17]|uniref:PKD domain-containing protein n=1 Tax=Candidatus Yanofskybacteria bacterium RIFCSPLOWO2_01_FULL_49_17 TaxID=1802700 RepID=A0A1F8GPE9_9BACT|nr:MAG: hypothetical protein A2941_00410 [Candidatus Yanofskybacteria bacterium RIFCSPLOWO2_01_FULL_49_17]
MGWQKTDVIEPDCDANTEGDQPCSDEGEPYNYIYIGTFTISSIPQATIQVKSNIPSSGDITGPNNFSYSIVSDNQTVSFSDKPAGSYTINPYNINCYDKSVSPSTTQNVSNGGTILFTVTYTNNGSCGGNSPPTVGLTFNGQSGTATITQSGSGTLTWMVGGGAADSCSASGGWSGSKSVSGGSENSGTINSSPTTFIIYCSNVYGSDQSTVTVSFTGQPPVYGCTDPSASNYNSSATADDGSCTYPQNNNLPYGAVDNNALPQDTTQCTMYGWGYDPDTPNTATTIKVYADGTAAGNLVDSFSASNYRGDLQAAGMGNGNHGFIRSAPGSLYNGTHTLYFKVVDTSTSQTVDFGNYSYNFFNCQDHPPIGTVDSSDSNDPPAEPNCTYFGGWAYDPDKSSQSIDVHVYDADDPNNLVFIGALTANGSRPDVNSALGITGNHGYTGTTPADFKDGTLHRGYVYAIGIDSAGNHTGSTANQYIGDFTAKCPNAAVDLKVKKQGTGDGSLTNGPLTINYYDSATLNWATTNANTCTASNGWSGSKAANGAEDQWNITASKTFNISCQGNYGPAATDSVTVNVNAAGAPTCDLTIDNTTLAWNNTGTTLRWTSSGTPLTTALNASGNWSGSKTPLSSGSQGTGHLEPGTYTYQLTATGPGGQTSCAAGAGVSVNVSAPTPTVTANDPQGPDYCVSGPTETISWSYTDPSGSPQTKYQVLVSNTGNFNNPMWDSCNNAQGINTCATGNSATSISIPNGVLQFNVTYKARIQIWNSYNAASNQVVTNSWKTPSYAYPQTSFAWTPDRPQKNNPIQFTDGTVFGGGNTNSREWSWSFGDGGTSSGQSPNHTYTTESGYTVTLTTTDAANQSCSISHSLEVQKPIPHIKEVAPR